MTTASKVRAIYTAPAPTATPPNQTAAIPINEHAVIKAWLRKMLIKLVARVLFACFFVGLGIYLESKHHLTIAVKSVAATQAKGGK
jgi:hypothetical protein